MTENLGSLSNERSDLRIPRRPRRGELWFTVDLAPLQSHTPEEVAEIARSMGYVPEVRIVEYFRDDIKSVEPALLLHYEVLPEHLVTLDSAQAIPEKLQRDWEALAMQIKPDSAVHLRRGLGRIRP
jgi:hypothetical protein